MRASSKYLYIAVAIVWLVLVGAGLSGLASYTSTPGTGAAPKDQWPATSLLVRDQDAYSLVMFVHPHCPCSAASMGELNRLMANCQGKLSVRVVFVRPVGMTEDWEKTDLWNAATAIPGVKVSLDEGGAEAALFDASTSGQTFLYSRDGALLFSGGITAGRGHAGDNAGSDAIALLVNGKTTSVTHTPVFGCQLEGPTGQRKVICRQ